MTDAFLSDALERVDKQMDKQRIHVLRKRKEGLSIQHMDFSLILQKQS